METFTLARNCLLPSLLKSSTIIFIVVVSRIRPSSAVHLVLDSRAVPTSEESTSVVSANPTMLLLGLCEGAVKHGDGFKRLGGADGWGGRNGGFLPLPPLKVLGQKVPNPEGVRSSQDGQFNHQSTWEAFTELKPPRKSRV